MGNRKGGTSIEELEDWARRMIDDVEDFDFAETADEWARFLIDKQMESGSVGLSDAPAKQQRQLDALERGRDAVAGFRAEVGVSHDVDKLGRKHIRGANGRFESRDTVGTRLKTIRFALAPPKRGWDE